MIWVDAQLSPALAAWIAAEFNHPAKAVRDLGLRNAKDKDIFEACISRGPRFKTPGARVPNADRMSARRPRLLHRDRDQEGGTNAQR
jgi:hypothetical protein